MNAWIQGMTVALFLDCALNNLMSIFPRAKRVRKRNGKEWKTLYRGIEINKLGPLKKEEVNFKDIVQFIPDSRFAERIF